MPELGAYDPNARPAESYDPIPPGKYVAMIVESDVRKTQNQSGELLWLKWQILEGEYEGRLVFDRINLRNANAQAQEIGQRQLASLRLATGINSPKASEEFHNIPCLLNVKVRPAGKDKQGIDRDAQNEIKGYERLDDTPAAPVAAAPAPAPQPARQAATRTAPAPTRQPATVGAAPASPPWKR